ADLGVVVGFHFVRVVREVRRVRGDARTWNVARYAAGFFEPLWLAGIRLHVRRAELLHVGEPELAERRRADAVDVLAVVIDLHFGAGRERRGFRGVVDELDDLRKINLVGIAD